MIASRKFWPHPTQNQPHFPRNQSDNAPKFLASCVQKMTLDLQEIRESTGGRWEDVKEGTLHNQVYATTFLVEFVRVLRLRVFDFVVLGRTIRYLDD